RNLEGHISSFDVNKLRFFPSGLVLLSAGMDMSVRIWSVETGECARSLKGHTQSVLDVGIIGKGQEVLSCSKDGTVKKWNCGSGQLVHNWPLGLGIVNAVSVDTDNKMYAAATENKTLVIQDLDSDELISRFVVDSVCTSVAIANGHCFAGTSTGDIYAFDMKNGSIETVLKTNRGRVTALQWSKLGLVAAFGDGTISTYTDQLDPGEYDFTGADCDPINDFAVTDKVLISVCRDKVVRKYDVANL
ncbi:proteasomal ATPase-associated factor 1, partial [Aphelenchoides avenae]